MNRVPRMFVAALMAAIALGLAVSAQRPPEFDLILRHGTVIDGTGLPRYRADVGIGRGFIARVGL